MLAQGDRVVVAVSGGPDSMALLHVLRILGREERWQVHAAHLHHALRGADADADLALVEAYAKQAGVPFQVERLAPGDLDGPGVEARARERRYAFLRRVAAEVGAARIATGHTLDDQAETVILRLLRGSGPRGLAGILPTRRDGVIRPLILARRQEALAYLERAGVAFREDATNRDPRFLRNRVRLELLPLLEALAPRSTEHLARLADRLRVDEAYLSGEARLAGKPWLDAGAAGAGRDAPDLAAFAKLPEAIRTRVLLSLLAGAGLEAERVSAAVARLEDHLGPDSAPGGIDLGDGLRLAWDDSGLRVGRPDVPAGADRLLPVPGVLSLWDGRSLGATVLEADAPLPDAAGGALFDLDTLGEPLRVRSRRPGDRMRPRGFGRWRKLKDVLIDAGVPRAERDCVPIVVAGDEIIWAAGLRASERGKPTAATCRRLFLTLRGPLPGSDVASPDRNP